MKAIYGGLGSLQFLANDFVVMLFHYDGVVDGWRDLEWCTRVVHVSAETKKNGLILRAYFQLIKLPTFGFLKYVLSESSGLLNCLAN